MYQEVASYHPLLTFDVAMAYASVAKYYIEHNMVVEELEHNAPA